MISDFIKGKKKFEFPPVIQQGIMLHRSIDIFTDAHPATKRAREVFRPQYRLYSGAFVDVVYDHFLATDPQEFPGDTLAGFSRATYATLDQFESWLPPGFTRMFPYMKSQDWLYHYHTREGTAKSFAGLVRRSAYLTDAQPAFAAFEQHYQLLGDCYRQFWPELLQFARSEYKILTGIEPEFG